MRTTPGFHSYDCYSRIQETTLLPSPHVCMQVNGFTQVTSNIYYIYELKKILLSIVQLQDKGLSILIQHGKCMMYHPTKGLITETIMSGNKMLCLVA